MILRKLGPSWEAAPVRRTIQVACLLLYLHLFFYVSWPYATLFSSQVLPDKEWLPVETFLWLDPVVGLSTALAARCWDVALLGMAGILATGLLFPRAFCGYLCPLGTCMDGFDFVVGKRIPGAIRQRVSRRPVRPAVLVPTHLSERRALVAAQRFAPGGAAG